MIRHLQPKDADPAAALIRSAFAAIPLTLVPTPSALRITAADIAAQLETGGGAVWEEQGGLRGCVLWRPVPRGLYLGRLAVAPGWQGRGIARMLLAAVDREAGQLGLSVVLLEVRLALVANRRLFAACGFRETALRTHPGCAQPTYAEAEKRLALMARSPGT